MVACLDSTKVVLWRSEQVKKRDAALKGKWALVKISEPNFSWDQMTQCAVRAGALGLIIASEECLFVAKTFDKMYVFKIPVVVIKATDADALLAPGTVSTLSYQAAPTCAAWEAAVAKHLDATASEGLRTLCNQPFVKTTDLEKEVAQIGMDKEELHSALAFLHSTGSVLHHGSGIQEHTGGAGDRLHAAAIYHRRHQVCNSGGQS